MNITKLRRMVAVYEAGSFRRAAHDLGMSQPALTWSIRQLEDDLNARLFDRGPRGIEPTPICEKLIGRARLILCEQDRMMADLERDSRPETLAIGIHSSMLHGDFARCVAAFGEMVPNIVLRIREGYSADLIDRLKQGALDLAYCTLPATVEAQGLLHLDPVTTLAYSVVARPDHPVFTDIAAGRAADSYPWAIFDSASGADPHPGEGDLDAVLDQTGYSRSAHEVRSASMSLIKLLVREAGHIGLMADEMIREELRQGLLRRLPHPPISTTRVGFVSVQGNYETQAVAKLKMLIRRLAASGRLQ